MDVRIDNRKKEFKKSFADPRRLREDNALQIRKATRDAHLTKKRVQAVESPDVNIPDKTLLPFYAEKLLSSDTAEQFQGAHMIRRLLSVEHNPPINAVINLGIVPRIVSLMRNHDAPTLQFECEWVLTNIASGTTQDTAVVVEAGALPILVELLDSSDTSVREQAIWAIGNIAGDSPQLRDVVLEHGVLDKLLRELQAVDIQNKRITLIRYATWALSNLCRGKPEPPIEVVKNSLPVLRRLLFLDDADVLTDACWALSYISDANPKEGDNRIHEVLMSGLCSKLVELLEHPNFAVQAPALRSVGNIVSGDDDSHTDSMLALGVLRRLKALLQSTRKSLRREACWTLSNVTAGTKQQIMLVIQEGIIPILVDLLNAKEMEVKKEAAWAISNAVSGGTVEQVRAIVDCGCIPHLCNILRLEDKKLVLMTLDAIENILKSGKKLCKLEQLDENPYLTLLETAGGFDALEMLQSDPVCGKTAMRIMLEHLELEEDTIIEGPYGGDNAFGGV